jgi:hypothetical protein
VCVVCAQVTDPICTTGRTKHTDPLHQVRGHIISDTILQQLEHSEAWILVLLLGGAAQGCVRLSGHKRAALFSPPVCAADFALKESCPVACFHNCSDNCLTCERQGWFVQGLYSLPLTDRLTMRLRATVVPWVVFMMVVILLETGVTGQGLRPEPGTQAGASNALSRLSSLYAKSKSLRAAYRNNRRSACSRGSGTVCGTESGRDGLLQLQIATSPVAYDARSRAQVKRAEPPKLAVVMCVLCACWTERVLERRCANYCQTSRALPFALYSPSA